MTAPDLKFALHKASFANNPTAAKMLLSYGAEVSEKAVQWACSRRASPYSNNSWLGAGMSTVLWTTNTRL